MQNGTRVKDDIRKLYAFDKYACRRQQRGPIADVFPNKLPNIGYRFLYMLDAWEGMQHFPQVHKKVSSSQGKILHFIWLVIALI